MQMHFGKAGYAEAPRIVRRNLTNLPFVLDNRAGFLQGAK